MTYSTDYNSDIYDQSDPVDVTAHGGRLRNSVAKISVVAAWDATTEVGIVSLPRACRLVRLGVYHGAISTGTDFDVGDSNDPDGIIDGYDASSAGQVENLLLANGGSNGYSGIADAEKPLWEVLGYSTEEDAPGMIDLVLSSNTDVDDASDVIIFSIDWVLD